MSNSGDILSMLQSLVPDGKLVGREFVARNPTRADSKAGSFSYNVDSGLWSDFATDAGGKGIVSYTAYVKSIPYEEAKSTMPNKPQKKIAAPKTAVENISYAPHGLSEGEGYSVYSEKTEKWQNKTAKNPYNYIHDGKVWSAVERAEATATANKQFYPMLWGSISGVEGWYYGTRERRHFYNIDRVSETRSVMIVSGEKCVDALQPLYEHMAVITWMGGDKALDKTPVPDALMGKKIILWADADESSAAAMGKLSMDILNKWPDTDLSMVNTGGFPDKYDCADMIAEGKTKREIDVIITARLAVITGSVTAPTSSALPAVRTGADYSLLRKLPDSEWVAGNASINMGGVTKMLRPSSLQNATNLIINMIFDGKKMGDHIAYNLFEDQVFITARPPWSKNPDFQVATMTDTDYTELRGWLELEGFIIGKNDAADLIACIGMRNTINPIKDYFERLVWDGVPRLKTWLRDYLVAREPDAYLSAVGTKWLVGGVNRVYEPGCKMDYCLIIEGEQGIRKSSLFEELATFNGEKYFSDMPVDFKNKDTLMGVQGKVIIEMPEVAGLRKGDINEQKAWLTRKDDDYRPPYGRSIKKRKRMFIVGGTANVDGLGLFADTTGGRRFWPVRATVHRIDIDKLRANKEQFWAEAVHLYKAGVRPFLSDGEEALAKIEQHDRRMFDVMEEEVACAVDRWLLANNKTGGFIMNNLMETMNISADKRSGGLTSRINDALNNIGWELVYRRQPDGRRKNLWYRKGSSESLEHTMPITTQQDLDNEPIVF